MSIKILEKKESRLKMKKEKNFWVENDTDDISVIANKVEPYGIQRYKISILNTDFDCKKIKLSNADNRYYYSYIFPNGSEKISRSRSECENCIGTENLILAEKQIEKNLRVLNKQLKSNLEIPIMLKLSELVEEHVKSYKSDFYHWDNYFIRKHNISKFIIVLRESGTHLLPILSDFNYSYRINNMLEYFIKNTDSSRKYFLCDSEDHTIKELTLDEVVQCLKF